MCACHELSFVLFDGVVMRVCAIHACSVLVINLYEFIGVGTFKYCLCLMASLVSVLVVCICQVLGLVLHNGIGCVPAQGGNWTRSDLVKMPTF